MSSQSIDQPVPQFNLLTPQDCLSKANIMGDKNNKAFDLMMSPSNFNSQDDSKVFLKEYDIEQNEHFVQYVFLPYFKDIYKDLSARSDKPQ